MRTTTSDLEHEVAQIEFATGAPGEATIWPPYASLFRRRTNRRQCTRSTRQTMLSSKRLGVLNRTIRMGKGGMSRPDDDWGG